MVETMTVKQAVEVLRNHGMKIGTSAVMAGLAAGAYPFGDCYRMPSGTMRYTVYARLLNEWIAARET